MTESGYLPAEAIEAVKWSVARILGVERGRINVYYEYALSSGQNPASSCVGSITRSAP